MIGDVSIADFQARVASHPLLARSLFDPPSANDLKTLRKRTTPVPLGLAEIYAIHDGALRPGGLLAFVAPIAHVPWLTSARWISIENGEEARDAIVDEGWDLDEHDVVIGRGKADHTWLVAGPDQVIRALWWRTAGTRRQRTEPTVGQTWPQLIAAFCTARGSFSLQDKMIGDAEDERTLLFGGAL
jgi:hypothetical protein